MQIGRYCKMSNTIQDLITTSELPLRDLIRGKRVLYLTVKNRSYIRSYQYKKIIDEEAASGICLFSEKANILLRVIDLKMQLSKVDFSGIDIVILGFLPQLLIKDIDSRLRRLDRKDVIIVSDFFLSLWDTITLDRQYVSPTGIIGRKLKKMDEAALVILGLKDYDEKRVVDGRSSIKKIKEKHCV